MLVTKDIIQVKSKRPVLRPEIFFLNNKKYSKLKIVFTHGKLIIEILMHSFVTIVILRIIFVHFLYKLI